MRSRSAPILVIMTLCAETSLARLNLRKRFYGFSSACVPPHFALASFSFNVVGRLAIKAAENEVHLLVIPEGSICSSGLCMIILPQTKPPPLLEQRVFPGSMMMEVKMGNLESWLVAEKLSAQGPHGCQTRTRLRWSLAKAMTLDWPCLEVEDLPQSLIFCCTFHRTTKAV